MDVHIDVIFSFLTLIFSFSIAQSTFVDDSDCFYRVENSLVVFADALAELVATHFFKHAKSFAAIFSFKFLFKLDFFDCRLHRGIFFFSKVGWHLTKILSLGRKSNPFFRFIILIGKFNRSLLFCSRPLVIYKRGVTKHGLRLDKGHPLKGIPSECLFELFTSFLRLQRLIPVVTV